MDLEDLIETIYYHVVLGQSRTQAREDLYRLALAMRGWVDELKADASGDGLVDGEVEEALVS